MLGGYSSTCVLHFVLWGYFVLEVLAIKPNVCHTPGCVEAAEIFKKNMDPSVNPCDDFYHFACGNYIKTEKIPKDQNHASPFTNVKEILSNRLLSLLKKTSGDPNEPKPFKMTRNLYNICLREDLAETRGVGVVLDMMKSVGGWPAMEGDNWDCDKFDWMETVYKLHDLGFRSGLFELSVQRDFMDRQRYIIVVDQVTFWLDREYLIQGRSNMIVKAYRSYMVDLAQLFGLKHDVAVKEIGDVLNFEMKLAKISLSLHEREHIFNSYKLKLIKYLKDLYPIVNWVKYINKMMNNINNVRRSGRIIVIAPSYLEKLDALVKRTDRRILANFLIWKAMYNTVEMLTSEMRQRSLSYEKFLIGKMEHQPHWKECLEVTVESMYLALGAMYVRKFFKEDAKENAVDIVENILTEMRKVLKDVDWMDGRTRSKAIVKLQAMQKHIGYSNELLEDKKLEQFYEKLEITGEAFFESVLNLTKFAETYNADKLKEIIGKNDWRLYENAVTIEGHYNPFENLVEFPAGIFQHVFFSPDRPKYMNYGAIGSVIAREVTHGFDFMGKDYDEFGDVELWWQPETRTRFLKKMQCFVKQANNYTVKSILKKLKGDNIQGEISAESGGIKLSYSAYNFWVSKYEKEPRLVGLEKFTPKQMFWLSAANVWCTVIQEGALKMEISTGCGPPAEYRVNGAMRNQEAFAKDFNCPVGSVMNPAEKCNVW